MNTREQQHEIACGPEGVKCTCGYKSSADGHEHAHILAMDHAKANPMSLIQHTETPNHEVHTDNG